MPLIWQASRHRESGTIALRCSRGILGVVEGGPLPDEERAMGRVQAGLDSVVARLYEWLAANRVTRLPWAVVQTFSRADGALLSGSMAYYTFLSILPLLLVAGFIAATLSSGSIHIRGALAGAIERIAPALEGPQILNQLIDAAPRSEFWA